jgi:crotonobetainyl-CoA:carnitine CoA-transferase CaiB-like acyl-CoA transferase
MNFMLDGIRVIEVAPFYPGPFCTQILAEHGADVIKVEPPSGDPMRFNTVLFSVMNRNKKSVVLDLKKPEDLKRFMSLAKEADVIVEGFRPGVAKKLGIDYDSVRKVNKDIIYCSISGFGQDSEFSDIPVHDINLLSMNGVCTVSGLKDGVPKDPNVQLADFSSAMFAVVSIVMALFRREKTGEGEYIDVSMFDSSLAAIPLHTAAYLNNLGSLPYFISNPGYEVYKTKDGYVSIGMLDEPHFWNNLCRSLGLEEYLDLEFSKRLEESEEIREKIAEKISGFTNEEIFETFRKGNLPFGLVFDVKTGSKISEKRGILCRGYSDREFTAVGYPVVYRNFRPHRDGKVPTLGENNSLTGKE